jgi:release factor glutamine methyltransferase
MQREAAGSDSAATGWTIRRVLAWAAEDFARRQFESARLDAELLLGEALGVDRIRLVIDRERPLSSTELGRFRELVRRRRAGEPVAYIRGRREFFGLEFRVDPRALIPRPDTETLVDVALERTRRRDLFGRAVDLCTGSGCVAIAFARERPTWRVTGVDIDPEAVALARENALRLGALPTVSFRVGDLFRALREGERFDLVTANPPYIPTSEYEALPPMIHDFEPRVALDGGADGLLVTARLIADAPAHLAPGGLLAVEVAWDQAEHVAELMRQAGLVDIGRYRDYAGIERVVSGRRLERDSCHGPV